MSDEPPKKMSIAERIAALQKQGNDDAPLPPLTKPKANKNNALAGRIAALQKTAETTNTDNEEGASKVDKPKVGKLKVPAGAVPMFGVGPPPSLLKKQKEREERMAKLQQEAQAEDNSNGGDEQEEKEAQVEESNKPKVGKLKPPPEGAVPIMPFGAGPPPSLLKKQKERQERMAKLQQEAADEGEAQSSPADGEAEGSSSKKEDVDVEDALLSRPTMKGKRRPRTRA